MSIASLQFRSDALGKRVGYNVILPDEGEGPFPVLMQLHGLSDDCNAWIQKSNLVRHVEKLPLVVVLPDGGTSAYLNWKDAGRLGRQNYEDLIVTDIANHVRRHLNVTQGPWAIGGLSMGGWGALWLGLKHADRFASIWAHSSKLDWQASQLQLSMLANPEDVDIVSLATQVATRDRKPVIAFDCGVDDELIEENRAFHRHLESVGLDHHYAEHPGGHTWDYWDDHVREALVQHARALRIQPVSD